MKMFLMLFSALFILNACSGDGGHSSITPMPNKQEPKDEKLFDAVTSYLKKTGGPAFSEYDFVRVDLNNDGRRDGMVLFKLPHSFWCGWDGCGMVLFLASKDDFTPLSTISNVRGPIYVSQSNDNAWKDIIIRVSGTKISDKNVIFKNNGSGYPQTPLLAPTLDIPLSALSVQTFFR